MMHPFDQPYPDAANDTQSRQNELWMKIQFDAHDDGIDLTSLPFAKEAIESIAKLAENKVDVGKFGFREAKRIDVHTQ
jgi:hypothetical protein